jgi:hypothetical protein
METLSMRLVFLALGILSALVVPLRAQDRDAKVRNDRASFQGSKDWIYNDLAEGVRVAKRSGKPMLVVFRCIPCEACQEFDDDVARRDPVIRDLMDQFVCVRIVQANALDLSHFRFDFDQSFAAFLMNPDMTIYGRFATRSERDESEDISLEGLRKAMEAALRMHWDYEAVKPSLAGKQVQPSRYKTPRDYPSLSGKYQATLDYEGKVARSCIHCHQVREAERRVYRSTGEAIPDDVLFPYPDPGVLGLTMDPKEMAKVERVAAGSSAERDGLKPGDEIVTLAGQPLLSVADIQWVLHNAPATGQLPAEVRRGGETLRLSLNLREDWRHGNISWRATSWDLRRMGLGGMRLDDLTDDQRGEAGLPKTGMALKVRHLGEFGDHAVAKRAGLRRGDVIVVFDGRGGRTSESELLAYAVQRKRPGEEVSVTVLREGERKTFRIALQ